MPAIDQQIHQINPAFLRDHLKDSDEAEEQVVESSHAVVDQFLGLGVIGAQWEAHV